MNKNRLLTAVAALATAGGVALSAAPAAGAATAVPSAAVTRTAPVTGKPVHRETIDQIPVLCNTAVGTKFRVTQSGINIRVAPGGAIAHKIAKNATFLSRGPQNQIGWTCVTVNQIGGTQWAFGIGKANRVHGWVGTKWLAVVAHGPGY